MMIDRGYLEKTCPFCGGKVFVIEQSLSPYENKVVFECSGCGMRFEYTQIFYVHKRKFDDIFIKIKDKPSPLEIWNMRKPIERIVERLEEMHPQNDCFEFEDDYIYAEERHNRYIKIVKEEGGIDG